MIPPGPVKRVTWLVMVVPGQRTPSALPVSGRVYKITTGGLMVGAQTHAMLVTSRTTLLGNARLGVTLLVMVAQVP